jgi:hypothetical protein
VNTDPVVVAALDAIAARDWARLRPLLHPYLHWTEPANTIRGRTKVLAHLAANPDVAPPTSFELRDGQIYRLTFP